MDEKVCKEEAYNAGVKLKEAIEKQHPDKNIRQLYQAQWWQMFSHIAYNQNLEFFNCVCKCYCAFDLGFSKSFVDIMAGLINCDDDDYLGLVGHSFMLGVYS